MIILKFALKAWIIPTYLDEFSLFILVNLI